MHSPAPVATPARTSGRVPLLTCVVTAWNVEQWVGRALDTALAQELGGELEIVVVDDGSTDGTAGVLRGYDDITVLTQPNGGFIAAVNAGLAAANGRYVTLLDGDDEWPPGRAACLVEELERRPELGLVHGDMRLIDASGGTIADSFFAAEQLPLVRGDCFGALLHGNFVSGGASAFRSSLLPRILPIPAAAAFPDWWIAVRIAEVAGIDHVPDRVNLYRRHGANMSASRAGRLLDEVRFRRWILTHLNHSRAPLRDLIDCAATMYAQAREAAAAGATAPPGDRGRALDSLALATRLAAELGLEAAARELLAALGHDPFLAEAGEELARVSGRALAESAPVRTRPSDTRGWVVAAPLSAAERDPGLLHAYRARVSAADDVSLVLAAEPWEAGRLEARLAAHLTPHRLDEAGAPDVVVTLAEWDAIAADAVCVDATSLERALELRP